MKKIVGFLMLIFGMNAIANLGYPCSMDEKKCVVRGFKADGKVIDEGEFGFLKEMVDLFNEFGESGTIDLVGHTDSDGTKKHNLKLSIIRAKNVARMMRELGLDERFSFGKITGEGENLPVDDNDRIDGRYINRRVEIFFRNVKFKNQITK